MKKRIQSYLATWVEMGPMSSLLCLNVKALAPRSVPIICLNGYNSCRRKARGRRNEYSCYVSERQFIRGPKINRRHAPISRFNRRQMVKLDIALSCLPQKSRFVFMPETKLSAHSITSPKRFVGHHERFVTIRHTPTLPRWQSF